MLVGGLAVTAAVLVPAVPLVVGIAGWGIAGLAMGLAYAPLSLTVLRQARSGEEGFATAGLQLSDVVGTGVGTGVGGALVVVIGGVAAGAAVDPDRIAVGIGAAFGAGALVALVGLALSGRLRADPTGQARAPLR